jgi:hypothetical protein
MRAIHLTATLNDDGVSGFTHSPAGSSGKSIATFSGDADLGSGVKTISYSLEIEVVHRQPPRRPIRRRPEAEGTGRLCGAGAPCLSSW